VARLLGSLALLPPSGGVNYVRLFVRYILTTQEPEAAAAFREVLRQHVPEGGCQLDTNIHLGRITAHNAVHRREVAEMLKAPPQDFRAGAVTPTTPHKPTELGDPGDGLAQRRRLGRR
jgi:hypothetical protein